MATLRINNREFKEVELCVFDKDGTLVDLYHYWSVMLDLRAEKIMALTGLSSSGDKTALVEAMGIDLIGQRIKPTGPVGLFPRTVVQKAAEDILNQRQILNLHEKCTQAFLLADEHSQKNLKDLLKLKPGITELLSRLKKEGVKSAVATSDKTDRTEKIIDALGLSHYFDLIVGFDSVSNPKPHPESLELINNQLNIQPKKSVIFGDTCSDMEMGNRAGYLANFILQSDLTDDKKLTTLEHHVIDGFQDITVT
ncbi:MAG: HAD family hydrolase [Candidatus Omnitrophica bacterium]|nr:HAD family hydrolase [Candidatus Omnitrophota bacterium]MCB9748188.1 HAD family hydrolase [Candidatus Omnitrophota bacterium]